MCCTMKSFVKHPTWTEVLDPAIWSIGIPAIFVRQALKQAKMGRRVYHFRAHDMMFLIAHDVADRGVRLLVEG